MKHTTLIELDAILDTRIGTVDRIDSSLSTALIFNKEYWNRKTDDFSVFKSEFDQESYKTLYKNRDKQTLMRSKLTTLLVFLKELQKVMEVEMLNSPEFNAVAYEINIHPYQFSEEEKEELTKVLRVYLGILCEIDIVDIPFSQQTLAFYKGKYQAVYLYNFLLWLEAVTPNLKEDTRAPTVSLMIPHLYADSKDLPTEADVLQTNDRTLNVVETTKLVFAEFIELVPIPIENYCLLEPTPLGKSP